MGWRKLLLVIRLYVWLSQGALSYSEEVDEFKVDGGEGWIFKKCYLMTV